MQIYAWKHTFYYISLKKAPRKLIFGVHVNTCILNIYLKILLEKKFDMTIYFLCILLFYEFIMYFFATFCFPLIFNEKHCRKIMNEAH